MVRATQVHFVTGKGGVGKTAVATALGLAAARQGQRVLVCEMQGQDKIAQLLQVGPVGYQLREVVENFWLVDIQAAAALHEYVLMVLKFDLVVRALLENRLMKAFLRLLPALGELVMLGKIWFHAQERLGGDGRFAHIIVDAPATGHAIALWEAPAAAMAATPAGPLRTNAALLHAMLTAAGQTRVHVVTTAEEMPVTEALVLQAALQRLHMRLGRLVLNAAPQVLETDILPQLQNRLAQTPGEAAAREACAPYLTALLQRQAEQLAGAASLAGLPAAWLHNAVHLPQLLQAPHDAHSLQPLVERLLAARLLEEA